MKRLMSDEEFRGKLEEAYYAGWNDGNMYYDLDGFDDWYDATYGGPDCE